MDLIRYSRQRVKRVLYFNETSRRQSSILLLLFKHFCLSKYDVILATYDVDWQPLPVNLVLRYTSFIWLFSPFDASNVPQILQYGRGNTNNGHLIVDTLCYTISYQLYPKKRLVLVLKLVLTFTKTNFEFQPIISCFIIGRVIVLGDITVLTNVY